MLYDRCSADAYSEHLAEVNRTRAVNATENIYNAAGILLIAKGAALDEQAARALARHKLQKPLADSVSVSDSLSLPKLLGELPALWSMDPDLPALLPIDELIRIWQMAAAPIFRLPPLVQKLTVLAQQLPNLYTRTLLGAGLFTWLSKLGELPEAMQAAGICAMLMRDIGYLHLEPALVRRQEGYSAEEWRLMESHPVIAKVILDGFSQLPNSVGRTVLEHHERIDGSGYPLHRDEPQLSLLGQLAGLADTLQAIWMQRLRPAGYGLGDLRPMLQVDALEFSGGIRCLALRGLPPARPHSSAAAEAMQPYIRRLLQHHELMREILDLALEALPKLEAMAGSSSERVLAALRRMTQVCQSAGLPSAELGRWIRHVGEHGIEAAFPEMHELGTLLDELEWQFLRLQRLLVDWRDQRPADPGLVLLEPLLAQLSPLCEQLENPEFRLETH